jgi:hypothetical protein
MFFYICTGLKNGESLKRQETNDQVGRTCLALSSSDNYNNPVKDGYCCNVSIDRLQEIDIKYSI